MAPVVKNLSAHAGDMRDPSSIPGEGNGNPLQYSCLENPINRLSQSLVGYRPWGRKELDTTEVT